MGKNFYRWSREKIRIENNKEILPIFHEQEIWWCSIGINIGDEEDGKNTFYERPVLVVRKFSNKLAWVVPLTTKLRDGVFGEVKNKIVRFLM